VSTQPTLPKLLSRPCSTASPRPQQRRPEATVLYQTVQHSLETFLARAAQRDRCVPRFVERELRAYLECGLLPFGFLRLRCEDCGHERLLAFSCKGRGFCPSCVGRRMSDTAAPLVDRVLPEVPVRQWVLSLPHGLRYRLAYDARLCSQVLTLFMRTLFRALRRRARSLGADPARSGSCGAVTFVQRFGDALNLNVHFHCLVLDGVYLEPARGSPRFRPLPPPSDEEVAGVPPENLAPCVMVEDSRESRSSCSANGHSISRTPPDAPEPVPKTEGLGG
jgi:hypothetical protein